MPIGGGTTGRDFWVRLPLTGLICGLPVAAKYSALPVVIGSGIYFFTQSGWRLSLPKLLRLAWFAFFLFLPGFVVFTLNRMFPGELTGSVQGNVALFPLGLRQAWNLLAPLLTLSGWHIIQFHTHLQPWVKWLLCLPGLAMWISLGFALYTKRKAPSQQRFTRLLLTMTAILWLFLLILTVLLRSRWNFDYTSDARYSYPVVFAWFCLAIVFMFDKEVNKIWRVVLAISCGLPIIANATHGALKPFLSPRPVPLPESRLAGTPNEYAAYKFLHERLIRDNQNRPELIIAAYPDPMNELKIPVVPWMSLRMHSQLMASRPIVVWALCNPWVAQELPQKLDQSATVERVTTPSGFPWEFLVISFR
jgi:hypothetical protein